MNRLIRGDVLSFARHYRGEKFHALLCDPPYHLTSRNVVTDWESMPAGRGKPNITRSKHGFMGKKWDGGDIAFLPDTWAALAEHLYPGAFGMAFASSRGWHRLAVAIENAGMTIHPSIFGWVTGQSFPKATRIRGNDNFNGHRYGLQSLKNSLEPVIVFQKPYEGKPIESIVKYGSGSLNIDGARISSAPYRINTWDDGSKPFGGGAGHPFSGREVNGRWPANFILVHSSLDGKDGCDESCPVRLLGEQSGTRSSRGAITEHSRDKSTVNFSNGHIEWSGYNDSGGASRFFYNSDWNAEVEEQLYLANPVLYQSKASRVEREAGLDRDETTVNDGRKKSIDNAYQRGETKRKNSHPTVKPISLNRWLATLLLPPQAYAPRRILIPFCGSGSEAIGALLSGWEYIVGVEGEQEYIDIGKERLKYWSEKEVKDTQLELVL